MKKRIAAIITILLVFALAACGAKDAASSGAPADAAGSPGAVPAATPGMEDGEQELTALDPNTVHKGGGVQAPSDEFVTVFTEEVNKMKVPDLRKKGAKVTELSDLAEKAPKKPVAVHLASFPEQGVYVFGYYDSTYGGSGILVDRGETQDIAAFPYAFTDSAMAAPDCVLSDDGSTLYMVAHTGGGEGRAVDTLLVFDLSKEKVTATYLDPMIPAQVFGQAISVRYNTEREQATVFLHDEIACMSKVNCMGGAGSAPTAFHCADFVWYDVTGPDVKVCCKLTLCDPKASNVYFYLNNDIQLEATLRPDGNGWKLSDLQAVRVTD